MRVLLAGLWARRGLNSAALLVTVLAIAASVLAPMYGRAAAEHLLDARISEREAYSTGLTLHDASLPAGPAPAAEDGPFQAPDPMSLVRDAAEQVDGPGVDRFWGPAHPWLLDQGGVLLVDHRPFTAPLYWRAGMCSLAAVAGRCPHAAGETLVQETMARSLGVGAGDTITLDFHDKYTRHTGGEAHEVTRARRLTLRVVGTYRIDDPGSTAWFDASRFTGIANLSVPQSSRSSGSNPSTPALLVAPPTMTSQTFVGGVDRPIDTAAVDLSTMPAVERAAEAYVQRSLSVGDGSQASFFDLASVFAQVRAEHTLLSRIILAAVAPLVVLTLLLLFALVSAAATIRRPYVALAKLRGHSPWQVLRFAVAEPFAVVAVATPVALALALGAARLVTRVWLSADTPVVLGATAVVSLVVVALASLLAALLAAISVIREPLRTALSSPTRSQGASRSGLVLRSAVVAVAVAAVLQLLTSGDQSSQLLALLAPLFIALAVAVAGAVLLRLVTRWWVRRTALTGGTPGYLASRRLGRRSDLANLMVPLLLAVSVITFAGSASADSSDWRVSRARAEVGAAATYLADASPGRLLRLTRQLDPAGEHLAAAVVDNSGDEMGRRVYVDTSRLASVAAWDHSWSDVPLSRLQEELEPHGRRISFSGREISLALQDVHLTSAGDDDRELWLEYVDDQGEQRAMQLGVLRNGPAQTLRADLFGCRKRCLVEQLYLAGSGQSVSDAQGSLTLTGVAVDGHAVDWRLTDRGAWRPARPFPVSMVDPPLTLTPGQAGLTLRVYLRRLPGADAAGMAMVSGYARITPATTPEVAPVLATATTRAEPVPSAGSSLVRHYPSGTVVGTALDGEEVPVRVVARVNALPVMGAVGSLGDLETSLVEFQPPPDAVPVVELWTDGDTPPALLRALRKHGVGLTPLARVDDVLAGLRSDGFSTGLRLFLLVGVVTLLLAVLGVFVSSVIQARWRAYEVAALRVVGVSRRTILRGSLLEHAVTFGLAVLLGLVSAYLSLRLVLPSISLGEAGEFDPVPVYATSWPVIAGVGAGLFVLAVAIALVVSRRITRMGRPATLRWAEQG
jgi:hypothetical protein